MAIIQRRMASSGEDGAMGAGAARWRPAHLLLGALAVEAVLIGLHLLALASRDPVMARFFDLGKENNVPTWFASMQLFLVAVVAFVAAFPRGRLPAVLRWPLPSFGAVFVFLSIDEFVGLHESITAMTDGLSWAPTFNAHGAWILPYCLIAALLLLAARHSALWLWRAGRPVFLAAAVGAALYIAGAVGFELVSYYLERASRPWRIVQTVEESLEMVGVSLILYAILCLRQILDGGDMPRGRAPA